MFSKLQLLLYGKHVNCMCFLREKKHIFLKPTGN